MWLHLMSWLIKSHVISLSRFSLSLFSNALCAHYLLTNVHGTFLAAAFLLSLILWLYRHYSCNQSSKLFIIVWKTVTHGCKCVCRQRRLHVNWNIIACSNPPIPYVTLDYNSYVRSFSVFLFRVCVYFVIFRFVRVVFHQIILSLFKSVAFLQSRSTLHKVQTFYLHLFYHLSALYIYCFRLIFDNF